jgi:hypothetical protein
MREALQPWLPSQSASPATITPQPQPVPAASEATASSHLTSQTQDIMARFQSLGDNCEFGLLPRWSETKPLDLQQVMSLQIGRQKLFEDLAAAQLIFVWKSNVPTSEADIRSLVACLRRFGPNLLLWVSAADADHPTGLVEYAGHGLLKGYVTRFVPYEITGDIDFTPWHAMCRNAAAVSDFLRQCGEWSLRDPDAPVSPQSNAKPPLSEVALEKVAIAIDWQEQRSISLAAGPVFIGTSFHISDMKWFAQNPGSQDIRGALLRDVVMDSPCSVLLHGSRKIHETRYLDTPEQYDRVHAILPGLRSIATDRVAVIGFNRGFRNFYHWMTQSLPALDLAAHRIGADRCALALPALDSWQEETLALLGLAHLPRIPIHLTHHYYFPQAYFSEYLSGRASFFLSPRSLEVFDKLAAAVGPSAVGSQRLYVARSDTANRPMTNEREVQALLESYGFATVIPGSLSIQN